MYVAFECNGLKYWFVKTSLSIKTVRNYNENSEKKIVTEKKW